MRDKMLSAAPAFHQIGAQKCVAPMIARCPSLKLRRCRIEAANIDVIIATSRPMAKMRAALATSSSAARRPSASIIYQAEVSVARKPRPRQLSIRRKRRRAGERKIIGSREAGLSTRSFALSNCRRWQCCTEAEFCCNAPSKRFCRNRPRK